MNEMKEEYVNKLQELLQQFNIKEDEIADIIADYGEMIDDANNKNISEDKIIKMIGTPEQVAEGLKEEFVDGEEYIYIHRGGKSEATNRDNKITALMPFISVIAFMILGLGFNLWHPGWLVFLSIPMVAIIVNAFDRNSMNGWIALSPFIALIVFLGLGFLAESLASSLVDLSDCTCNCYTVQFKNDEICLFLDSYQSVYSGNRICFGLVLYRIVESNLVSLYDYTYDWGVA